MPRKILITGGAGFIGSHLARRLCRKYQVTIVDDLSIGSLQNVADIRRRIKVKIMALDSPGLRPWLQKQRFYAVFHLAGNAYTPISVQSPLLDAHQNINATLHLVSCLSAQKPLPRLVYASTAAVYGEPASLPLVETSPLAPISPHGIGKLAAENYLRYFHRSLGLPVQILRLFSCYGPGQAKQVVWDLAQKLRRRPAVLTVLGTGQETRDFTYVEDLVQGVEACFQRGRFDGTSYQLASGQKVRIRKLAAALRDRLSPHTRLAFDGRVRPGDPVRWQADLSRARRLGYRPQVGLEEGLRKTCQWILSLA